MTLLAVVFFAGIIHGLGPDHLAAVSIFGGQGRLGRLAAFSSRFALGHCVIVAAAGLLAKFGRDLLPRPWETGVDILSGLLLIVTGIALALGKIAVHDHIHHHEGVEHSHWHAHVICKNEKFAWLLGGFFALGGLRALLVVVPIAIAPTLGVSALRILLFAVGMVLSMTLYGAAGDALLKKFKPVYYWPGQAIAVMSIIAGLYTLGQYWR